jgi:hypothetical protein
MTEDEIRELLREMRDEPVPPDSKARVRMAVAERTQSWPEKLRRRWKVLAAVVAPACLVLVLMMTWQKKVDVPPPPVAPAPPVVIAEAPAPAPHIVRARHHVSKPPRVIASNGASLIRIETPDPDVVILLIGG